MYVSELCVHVPFQALFLRQVSRVIFRARSRVNFLIFRHRQNNNNNTTKVTYNVLYLASQKLGVI